MSEFLDSDEAERSQEYLHPIIQLRFPSRGGYADPPMHHICERSCPLTNLDMYLRVFFSVWSFPTSIFMMDWNGATPETALFASYALNARKRRQGKKATPVTESPSSTLEAARRGSTNAGQNAKLPSFPTPLSEYGYSLTMSRIVAVGPDSPTCQGFVELREHVPKPLS